MAPGYQVQSAKVVRRLPPLLEVRTPIAKAIWGKKTQAQNTKRVYLQRWAIIGKAAGALKATPMSALLYCRETSIVDFTLRQ